MSCVVRRGRPSRLSDEDAWFMRALRWQCGFTTTALGCAWSVSTGVVQHATGSARDRLQTDPVFAARVQRRVEEQDARRVARAEAYRERRSEIDRSRWRAKTQPERETQYARVRAWAAAN